MRSNIEFKLNPEWLNVDGLILYGFGGMTRDNIKLIQQYYDIVCILDSDKEKCGGLYSDVEVKWIVDNLDIIKDYKIIIMSSGYMADEIAGVLIKNGLRKYDDFCTFEEWIMEVLYRKENKVCLFEVNTSITSRCTLNCRNCNMFMPYFKKNVEYTLNDVKLDLNALFRYVDYVCKLTILGGEPLLNKELPQILLWISEAYGNRIGKLTLISNGTIIPNDELLRVCSEKNVSISISDYTEQVPYKDRLNDVVSTLKANKIEYQIRKDIRWCDFGFPAYRFPVPTNGIREHMLNCGPVFHGLNDRKLYYCHCSWAANKCGIFNEKEGDFVALVDGCDDKIKEEIINHCKGETAKGYVGLCAVCGGCGSDNDRLVKAAVQMERLKNE